MVDITGIDVRETLSIQIKYINGELNFQSKSRLELVVDENIP